MYGSSTQQFSCVQRVYIEIRDSLNCCTTYAIAMAGRRHEAAGRVALAYQSHTRILKDKLLGIGSYGAVYKAQCGDLVCAAKLLHPTLFDPSVSLPTQPGKDHRLPIMRFEQECEFMSSIK